MSNKRQYLDIPGSDGEEPVLPNGNYDIPRGSIPGPEEFPGEDGFASPPVSQIRRELGYADGECGPGND
jgi:hypothetical protein